jgi:hypothetical protein
MANDFVAILKAKQDALDARKKDLLDKFFPFRQDLVNGLETIVTAALENGIHSVKPLKRVKDSNELVEAAFALNFLDLVLLSSDDVNKLELDKDELAAKIFIYSAGDDEHTPLMEINFIEALDDNHVIRAQWFSNNGPRLFFKEKSMSENVAGRLVTSLLNHFYFWEFAWQDKPTMRSARGKESKRPFGLIPE